MRTTLNIEEDALSYAKERARLTGKTLGEVISEALRETARPRTVSLAVSENGLPYIPARPGSRKVTRQQVSEALEQEEMDKYASA